MSTPARIVSRTCPSCTGTLEGQPGHGLLVCPTCPTALDVSGGSPIRLATWRPRDEPASSSCRLALFLFRLREGEANILWIPAFRVLGRQKPGRSLGELLTADGRYDPPLVEAPLATRCARDLRQATAVLRYRLGIESTGPPPVSEVRLVSLACRIKSGTLREPVSGWTCEADRIWPALGAPGVSPPTPAPSAASEAARLARQAQAVAERQRTWAKVKKVFEKG